MNTKSTSKKSAYSANKATIAKINELYRKALALHEAREITKTDYDSSAFEKNINESNRLSKKIDALIGTIVGEDLGFDAYSGEYYQRHDQYGHNIYRILAKYSEVIEVKAVDLEDAKDIVHDYMQHFADCADKNFHLEVENANKL